MAWLDLLGDKALVIMAGALTALVSTGYGHLSSQTHLFAAMEPHDSDWSQITIENISINKAVEYHLIIVECVGGTKCLPPFKGRIDEIGTVEPVPPASVSFNQPCRGGDSDFLAAVSLPLGGKVEVYIAAKPEQIRLSIAGKTPRPPCGMANLTAVDTQLLQDTSMGNTVKSSMLRNSTVLFNAILAVFVLAVAYFVYQLSRRKRRVVRKIRIVAGHFF